MIMESFADWHNSISEEIDSVSKLMAKPLEDEPETLIQDLISIEAWNARVGFMLAEANSWLDRVKLEARPPKEAGIEFDRRLILDSAVSPVRLVRDRLESLRESIKQRLSIGQSILKLEVSMHSQVSAK